MTRTARTALMVALACLASAACSAILDLQPPPTPAPAGLSGDDSGLMLEASPGDAGLAVTCLDLDAADPDGRTGSAATYSALDESGDAAAGPWAFYDLATNRAAQGFSGGAFDGRYVYLAPDLHSDVTRLDTAADGGFAQPGSWSVFDVASLSDAGAGPSYFSGATFDGRFVYFVPRGATGVPDGRVVRFDSTGTFKDSAAWSTFDTLSLVLDGGAATKGFSGAGFDGRYVYLVPNNNGSPDGRVVRFDTTVPEAGAPGDAGRADAGDGGDAGGVSNGGASVFGSPALWSTFDVSSLNPSATGFFGAAFDGTFMYLVGSFNGGVGNAGNSGITARVRVLGGFTNPASWSTFDMTTFNGDAVGFAGAAFDGHYLYFVPCLRGVVLRLDTTSNQPTSVSAWSAYDLSRVVPIPDGGSLTYATAAFDGRFVYLVPSAPAASGFAVVARYDTRSTFNADCAWSTVDLTRLNPGAINYVGAVFDGQYVYLVPHGNGVVARFSAKTPPSRPNLPAFHGSFY